MSAKKPEALRLADALAYCDSSVASQAAAELRRLHTENSTLHLIADPEWDGNLSAIEGLRAKACQRDELLEFVKFVVREWGYDGLGCELEDEESSVIDRARVLIAKTEGNGALAAVAGPLNELEELRLLNTLIDIGARAMHAHAKSNSDDGHAGTAAHTQWHELRAEMGKLIRKAYAAPTTQPAHSTYWAAIAPCGEGVLFTKKQDACWTITGKGAGSDGFGHPVIGEEFRKCYSSGLKLHQVQIVGEEGGKE